MNEFGGRRAPLVTLLASAILLTAAAFYVGAHWLLPSDGTTLNFSDPPPLAGMSIGVWRPGQNGLEPGDILLAMDGRSLDDWILAGGARPAADQSVYRIQRAGELINIPVSLGHYDALAALGSNWTQELALAYLFGVGAVVFALRRAVPGARALFLLSSAIFASSLVYFLGLQASDLRYGWLVGLWIWNTVILFGVAMAGLLHFSFVFPQVRPTIARRPAVLGLVYGGVWLPYLGLLAANWPLARTAAARLGLLVRSTGAISATYFILVMVNTLIGYRQARTEAERRQLRWIVWATYVATLPWVALDAAPGVLGLPPIVSPGILGVAWFTLPTAFAIAILRERLFDIDVIIRRTLLYSTLTAALALVYFGSVVILQAFLAAFTGQNRSTLATVLSTLAIAALFGPARRRLQGFIDRRFYRRRYDAARALAGFGASVRDSVDLDEVSARLVAVVDETMQPAAVSLWIKSPQR